jgi:hypothetical protein
MMQTIVDNGEVIEVSNEEILFLAEKGMVYLCPDCNVYHTDLMITIDECVTALNEK